jgi:hypothetical protein
MAPGVRFNAFAILATPDLAFAIVFIVRTSSFVHARRTTFLVFAILTPIDNAPDFLRAASVGNEQALLQECGGSTSPWKIGRV